MYVNFLLLFTVLFIHSDHIRSDLFSWELSQETSFSHDSWCASLLDKDAIKDTKTQILFLLTIVSRLDSHNLIIKSYTCTYITAQHLLCA